MIRAMFNLRCGNGHRFYSPDPAAWNGSDCGHPNCREKLSVTEPPAKLPPLVKVSWS